LDENFADAAGNLSERQISSNRHRERIIAQKMVATFNSTGTPSLFLHASEAIHGDFYGTEGRYYHLHFKKTVLNKSGCPFKLFTIAITGNMTSFLAKESNYVLNTTVDAEACPIIWPH
jgi:arabinose-5-phosphate isomerase